MLHCVTWWLRCVLAVAASAVAAAQDLIPAGTINAAVSGKNAIYLVEDDARVERYVEQIAKRFRPDARKLIAAEALATDLTGSTLIVYGTPAHAWLAAQAARLPFRWSDGAVEIDGRKFEGERLRVICAVKNPHDLAHRAVVYTAARAADLVGINTPFHGPTEWVVADGDRTLAAGSFTSSKLPVAALHQDLDFLVQTIGDVHPATTAGMTADVAAAVTAARAELGEPLSRAGAWRVFARVLRALHDAHSGMAPAPSGEQLGLPLLWLAEGLVVSDDAGELQRGDRIVSINGHDEARLLAALQDAVPAENGHWLRARGEQLLGDLGVLRALDIAAAVPVTVRIERDGAERDVAVGLALAGRSARAPAPWVRSAFDRAHDLAVFTLDRCVVDDDYRDALDEFFIAVHEQGIGRVAVDLRANSGGNSMVLDEFLRYVDIDGYLSFGGEVRSSAAAVAQRGAISRLETTSPPERRRNVRHSDPPPFGGELWVLTGKRTFSSGNWFAVVVQDNGIGKVVGEPTGNAPSSFGDILSFAVPNSGLSFTLSYKRWVRPHPERDPADALLPDVAVPLTRADVRDGNDPVLAWLRDRK